MKKQICVISGIVLLVSLSCQFLAPRNIPQPQTNTEQATVPAEQPEPTQEQPPAPTEPLPTAALPPTPTADTVLDDMKLMFWDAKVSYDPAVWLLTGTEYPRTLAHQQIATCSLYEQGPTEPPPTDREATLGPVTYLVAEMESDGKPVHWYMAVKGPQGPFIDGAPTLVISSSPDQFEECRSSAEQVLATLR